MRTAEPYASLIREGKLDEALADLQTRRLLTDAEKANITFTITYPDGNTTTLTYSQFTNGEYTLNNVLTGTYTVTETNRNPSSTNYTVTSTYSVNGGTTTTLPSSGSVSVPVTVNGTNEVDFTNTYTAIGKITLSKTVGGNYWGDFGTTYNTQAKRRSRIRNAQYNLYRVNADGTRTKVGNTITLATNQGGYFYNTGTYTWSNLPVGNYEIDEVMTDTNGTYGSVISNTTRTTTVTVNGGIAQTTGPVEGGNTVKTGSFSVTNRTTMTASMINVIIA